MPGRFEEIRVALECARARCSCQQQRRSILTHCPAHDDNNPSLSLTRRDDGDALASCKAGCPQEAVIAALTERGLWAKREGPVNFQRERQQRRARPEKRQGKPKAKAATVDTNRRPDHVWYFCDAEGTRLVKKARWDGPGGAKTFKLQAHDQTGWSMGTMTQEEVPLYGTELLAVSADPLYITEGEKCADRVRDEGVLGLCPIGGASQRQFGSALFPLAGRRVYTLADNDPEGDEFMAAIEAELRRLGCDVRRLHLPVLPGEDIYDYLEAGHTLVELMAQQFLDPFVEPIHGGLRVHVPADTPGTRHVYQFDDLETRRREITADLTVAVRGPMAEGYEHTQRINVLSSSAVEGLTRRCGRIWRRERGQEEPFERTVSEAIRYVVQYMREREHGTDVARVPEPGPIAWRVRGFLQRGQPHVLFGDGEAGKSMTALHIAASVAYGLPVFGDFEVTPAPVLYVDYETDNDGGADWRRRVGRVLAGIDESVEEGRLYYWPGDGTPLAEQAEALRRFVARRGIGLMIVDSVVPALGGSPLDTEPIRELFGGLRRIGSTSLLIAHISQAEAETKSKRRLGPSSPYGNRYWHNLPRGLYRLDVVPETLNSDLRALAMYPTKANNWRRQGPIYIEQRFDGEVGPITFTRADAPWHQGQQASDRNLTWEERVLAALTREPGQTVAQLAEGFDANPETIRTVCKRAEGKGLLHRQASLDGADLWHITA